MKNTLVRAFVFSLVFTGLVAGTASFRHASSNVTMAKGGNTSLPTPVCAPGDPTHCGMD